MRRETAIGVGLAVFVLGGLALIQGCQSGGDEAVAPAREEPVVEAPLGVPESAADAPVAGETGKEGGAADEAEEVVTFALAFAPERTTTYKVTTEAIKKIRWEGDTAKKPAAFTGGTTGNRVEVTFDQQIERVEDSGHAIVKITIKALKYWGQVRGNVALDFDSARPADKNSPMATLIGQSYKLEITSRSQLVALTDIEPAREAVQGITPAHRTATKLLSDRAIQKRHSVAALATLESDTVRPEEHWSNNATFSFDMLGVKAYERIYTLQRIERDGDARDAVVVMKAIPSVAAAAHQGQAANPLAGMFDTTDSYEGGLRFDLTAGQIEEHFERLDTEWVIVDPAAIQSGEPNPAVLRMSASESHRCERVD